MVVNILNGFHNGLTVWGAARGYRCMLALLGMLAVHDGQQLQQIGLQQNIEEWATASELVQHFGQEFLYGEVAAAG